MKKFLYDVVELISKIHDKLMDLNNGFENSFNDKQLHFLVIGALGMMMIFVIYPLFKWLAKNNYIMIISWIYVFTCMIVITFAIEIGQKITGTGNMEFADIVFGILGFLLFFEVFGLVRVIYHLLIQFANNHKKHWIT